MTPAAAVRPWRWWAKERLARRGKTDRRSAPALVERVAAPPDPFHALAREVVRASRRYQETDAALAERIARALRAAALDALVWRGAGP